jgi:peptidoglycan/xylan/chitin deacetylase (PgdA/CDA1 family)
VNALRRDSWVCLMYHDIGPVDAADPGREWFAVSWAAFLRQLDLVRETGYAGCSIARAIERCGPRVAISFDDGMRSDYERAFPALAARGMTATFFVVTGLVGSPGHVSWSELREMREAGMSVQSHTRSHPFLSELGARDLRDELVESKQMLDDALGQDTDQLALPGGDPPRRRLHGIIAETGYRVVATSRWGCNRPDTAQDPMLIRRCTISGNLGEQYFRRVLRGDRVIGLRRGLREFTLRRIRAALGPSRYAVLRRRVLGQAPTGVPQG